MTPRDPAARLLACDACGLVFAARAPAGACARCPAATARPWRLPDVPMP